MSISGETKSLFLILSAVLTISYFLTKLYLSLANLLNIFVYSAFSLGVSPADNFSGENFSLIALYLSPSLSYALFSAIFLNLAFRNLPLDSSFDIGVVDLMFPSASIL